MFDDFFKAEKITPNPELKRKMEELFNLYSYCETEVNKIKSLLKNAEDKRDEILEQQNKYNDLVKAIEVSNKEIEKQHLDIENKKQVLIDLNNEIKRKEDLNKSREDLTDVIFTLKKEQDEIIAFNKANKIEKEDFEYTKKQLDLMKSHLLELENKKGKLVSEIRDKEKLALKFDRDLEEPKRILKEIKDTELAIKTTHEATQKLIAEQDEKPQSIGQFIRKAQKKYPKIDLLNI